MSKRQSSHKRLPLGRNGGGGGGDDPDDYEDEEEYAKKRRRKKKASSYVVPPSIDTYPWGNILVNGYRYNIGGYSIWAMVSIAVVIWLWYPFQWIPGIPPALMRYGVIEYIPFTFVYFINLFLPAISKVTEVYFLFFCFNLAAWFLAAFLSWVLFYNFYHCWNGDLPSTCTANYLIDIIMCVPTGVIWFVSFMCTVYYFAIVTRTSGTSRPYVIEYNRV
jgi:hypothetical protein